MPRGAAWFVGPRRGASRWFSADFEDVMMDTRWRRALRESRGTTAIEYAFVASLIAVVIIGGVRALGLETRGLLCSPLVVLEQVGVDVTVTCE